MLTLYCLRNVSRGLLYRAIKSLCVRVYAVQHNTIITTRVFPASLLDSICLAADLHGQWDTRLTLKPSVIPNSNYVIMVCD
jgi:hypothetical protein